MEKFFKRAWDLLSNKVKVSVEFSSKDYVQQELDIYIKIAERLVKLEELYNMHSTKE